jgi:streptogramin lyase
MSSQEHEDAMQHGEQRAIPFVPASPKERVAPLSQNKKRILIGVVLFVVIVGSIGFFLVRGSYNTSTTQQLPATGTMSEFPLQSARSSPEGIIQGPDGALWFTEVDGNKIGRITTSGTISEFPLQAATSWPIRITRGSDGALWFTELLGNKIGRITLSGKISEFPLPTADSQPQGITQGPDGAIWFAELQGNKIGRLH